jgi:N,N-dimethylformamidase
VALASLDAECGRLAVGLATLLSPTNGGMGPYLFADPGGLRDYAVADTSFAALPEARAPMLFAACCLDPSSGQFLHASDHYSSLSSSLELPRVTSCFNGKIEEPRLGSFFCESAFFDDLVGRAGEWNADGDEQILARWDFAAGIGANGVATTEVIDVCAGGQNGVTVNLPVRGATGRKWSGVETSYRHAPREYGAIYFHDDDLDDARWIEDFRVRIPPEWKSGFYAARLALEGEENDEEYVPFCVRARTPSSHLAVLLPTATYMAYANDHAQTNGVLSEPMAGKVASLEAQDVYLSTHREYGLSLYGLHSDGSGVCHSSRLRPMLNIRPHYRYWAAPGPTPVWTVAADLQLLYWLESESISYDLYTDEDLDAQGAELLREYRVVLTGTHPEYTTEAMMNAISEYVEMGGRFMYLGGNGFYWITCFHPENRAIIEVRRGESGVRAWTSAPGEAWNAFDGRPGGLWRSRGRIATKLFGVNFAAFGFDASSYYRRLPISHEPECAWIFAGIDGDIIGDSGLIGGGAAGLELDRYDPELGAPKGAYVLAHSEGHSDLMMEVNEDILYHVRGYYEGGDQNPQVRSDIVYFKTPNGGAVFSTGSIAWCGALLAEDGKSSAARVTRNVISGFLGEVLP